VKPCTNTRSRSPSPTTWCALCTPPLCAYRTGGVQVTAAKDTDGVLDDGTLTLGFGPLLTMSQRVPGSCGERTATVTRLRPMGR
jgi:hypothetical protein